MKPSFVITIRRLLPVWAGFCSPPFSALQDDLPEVISSKTIYFKYLGVSQETGKRSWFIDMANNSPIDKSNPQNINQMHSNTKIHYTKSNVETKNESDPSRKAKQTSQGFLSAGSHFLLPHSATKLSVRNKWSPGDANTRRRGRVSQAENLCLISRGEWPFWEEHRELLNLAHVVENCVIFLV